MKFGIVFANTGPFVDPVAAVEFATAAESYKAGAQQGFLDRIPGTEGQPHRVPEGPSHFIQEDAPEELVAIIGAFVAGDSPGPA